MERNKTKYFTVIELKWGLILAASSLLWIIIERWLGWYSNQIPSYVRLTNIYGIPALLIYCLALAEKREKDYSGELTWKDGFIAGLMITLIFLILTPLIKYTGYTFIAPEYFKNIIDFGVNVKKKDKGALTAFFNMKNVIVQGLYGVAIMGALCSAVAALIVKKRKKLIEN